MAAGAPLPGRKFASQLPQLQRRGIMVLPGLQDDRPMPDEYTMSLDEWFDEQPIEYQQTILMWRLGNLVWQP